MKSSSPLLRLDCSSFWKTTKERPNGGLGEGFRLGLIGLRRILMEKPLGERKWSVVVAVVGERRREDGGILKF